MKTRNSLLLVGVVLLGLLTSAFMMRPNIDLRFEAQAQLCAQNFVKAAAIDIPSHRTDYQLLERANTCAKIGQLSLVPATGSKAASASDSYAEFKLKQAERVMDGR